MSATTRTPITGRPAGFYLAERRDKARIYLPFPARIVGRDTDGVPFEVVAALDNLCASGAYFRIPIRVPASSKLLVIVDFGGGRNGDGRNGDGLGLEFFGSVVRVEPDAEGGCGVAVHFSNSIFL
jgi:hypothetical protein